MHSKASKKGIIPPRPFRSSKFHAGVKENERSKRACQAETGVEAPTQLLYHTKDHLTEGGHGDTLPVQTEASTQLTSNEAQHDTQLIDVDMGGSTVVIHSDGEYSGDTEVLPDDLELHCNSPSSKGDDESGFRSKARMLSDGNVQNPLDPEITSAFVSMKHTDGELEKAEEYKEVCDSDATTEEVKEDDAGDLGGAESVVHDGQKEGLLHSNIAQQNTNTTLEIENGPSEKAFKELQQGFHGTASEGHTSQGGLYCLRTPKANDLSPNVSVLRSRSGSIASVRAASLRASGLQAAARSGLNARGRSDKMDKYDSDSTIEQTPETVEDLRPCSKALREKSTSKDRMESVSVPFESINPDMSKSKSHTAVVSHTIQQPTGEETVEGHAIAGEKCELKSHFRKPHGQKVRKLSFEFDKISDKTPPSEAELLLAANKEVDTSNPAINPFLTGESRHDLSSEKTVESTDGPRRELSRNLIQHGSLPSGFISASTNLSYLESQEPGEESQLNALNVVDKLFLLNVSGMSQDSEPNIVSQQNCVKASQKAAQSLAHTVELKNIQEKMGVYDWVDSQKDDSGLPSDAKGDSAPQRKRPGISRSVRGRKKQVVPQQSNITSRLQAVNKSDDTTLNKEMASVAFGRTITSRLQAVNKSDDTALNKDTASVAFGQRLQSNMKPVSQQNQGMEPQMLAEQKRGRRRKGGTGQTKKEENTSSLEKCKNGEQNKPTKESSKLIKHDIHKDEKESPLGFHIGSTTRAQKAIDMSGDDLIIHDASAEKKGKRKSKVDTKSNQTKSTNCTSNAKETMLAKEGIFRDEVKQEMELHHTKSGKRESTKLSKSKGGERASLDPLEEQQCNTEKEDNTVKEEFMKKGLHTRSKAQNLASTLADSETNESFRAQIVKNNDSNSKIKPKMQEKKEDNISHSNVVSLGKPNIRKCGKQDVTEQQPTMNIGQEDTVNAVRKGRKKNYNSSRSIASGDGQEGSSLHCLISKKDNKREREATDRCPSDMVDTLKLDSSAPRKRRSSLCVPITKEKNTVAAVEEETKSVSYSLKNRVPNRKDADTERELAVPAIITTTANKKKKTRQGKKIASSEAPTESGCSLILEEGRKRKRERGCICVLFSHSLSEESCKNQKKILARLGGHVAMSAADCTHFVIDCFVRTRNMLESIAAGKPVVTSLWLENCGQAHYFVDEKNYILQDARKEKELGFSMLASLAAAQRRPILQGFKLLLSPKIIPDQEAMAAIIQSAGGQVVESMPTLTKINSTLNGNAIIVIASEEDHDFCLPFVERGFKVYSTELILSGIVSQNLDFSRNQLFDYSGQLKRSSRRARASTFQA